MRLRQSSALRSRMPFRCGVVAGALLSSSAALAAPKVVILSIDGASPRFVNEYLASGALPANEGLGLLKAKGLHAKHVVTTNPSLTAVAHVAIGTGSSAARNDVVANTFHLHASPFSSNVSGFGAPIGGYDLAGPGPTTEPTAIPLWVPLLEAGRTVVAATFPGADGAAISVPGAPAPAPLLQSSSLRTVTYTIPFGAFGGQGARGFELGAAAFAEAPGELRDALMTASPRPFYGPVRLANLESVTVGGVAFEIGAAALDTTDDGAINYDSVVVFDRARGITPGPFLAPSTGPAYLAASEAHSQPFYFEGTANRVGTAYYLSHLDPELGTVRIARYSANFIPRNAPVLADVDDMNTSVGFWAPQPDYRIPERLSPGFERFTEAELEAIYQDQVETFTDYQSSMAVRAIERNPNADLVLLYFEQPDGSFHQFLLTDPRQPTDFTNPASILDGQDQAKIARYAEFRRYAYQAADEGVARVIRAVGVDDQGKPEGNVLVVSDHGFEAFHTAVSLANLLSALAVPELVDTSKVRFVTSGPAVNVYINLEGRNAGGTVPRSEYAALQARIEAALRSLVDRNANYANVPSPVFDQFHARPVTVDESDARFGLETSELIGQDSGDVYAVLAPGYNFDGVQSPVVPRKGDATTAAPVLSVPNFYGAHGYDPELPNLSAILYAAGPDIPQKTLDTARTIDVAPTVLKILGVEPPDTVEGTALDLSAPTAGAGGAGGAGGASSGGEGASGGHSPAGCASELRNAGKFSFGWLGMVALACVAVRRRRANNR